MGTYATIDAIKDASPNISVITDGSDEDILRWANEAFILINRHCAQDFTFESQVTKSTRATGTNTWLPKVISGDVTVYANLPGLDPELVDNDEGLELDTDPGVYWLRYLPLNRANAAFGARATTLAISADWGYPLTVEELLVLAANDFFEKYNAHLLSTTHHLAADSANGVSGTAQDTADVITMLNALKAAYNLHAVSTVYHEDAGTDLITAANATDEDSCVTLALDIKAIYNLHIADTEAHLVADTASVTRSVTNPIMPPEIVYTFIKVVQRIAIRDNDEDFRYQNSGYTNESFSDGYSYSLANGQLRNLIMPQDEAMLAEHCNDGVIAS